MKKQKHYLLLFLFGIAINVYSQPNPDIKDEKEIDTAAINAMLLESKDLLKTDVTKAIGRARLAGDMADKIDYTAGKALALKTSGSGISDREIIWKH